MGQVPPARPLALLGSGRMARHMHEYLRLLGVPVLQWSRRDDPRYNSSDRQDAEQRLVDIVHRSERLWLLVSDAAIEPLSHRIRALDPDHRCQLMHASGSLSLAHVAAVHPLMSFADTLYPLSRYESIPFVTEPTAVLDHCLPELPNRAYVVDSDQRALYHSLCVISGNFAQILWHRCREDLQHTLGLPGDVLMPYLKQVCDNFIDAPDSALTGPLVRGDEQTIAQHLGALVGHPLEPVYRSILGCYQPEHAEGCS